MTEQQMRQQYMREQRMLDAALKRRQEYASMSYLERQDETVRRLEAELRKNNVPQQSVLVQMDNPFVVGWEKTAEKEVAHA